MTQSKNGAVLYQPAEEFRIWLKSSPPVEPLFHKDLIPYVSRTTVSRSNDPCLSAGAFLKEASYTPPHRWGKWFPAHALGPLKCLVMETPFATASESSQCDSHTYQDESMFRETKVRDEFGTIHHVLCAKCQLLSDLRYQARPSSLQETRERVRLR